MLSQAAAESRLPVAPGGLLPWLASLWRDLRQAAEAVTASKEQRELVVLVEYAASHLGDPLLHAESVDDLDDRIDERLTDPAIFHLNALLFQLALPELRQEPASSIALTATEAVLGATPARMLANASDVLVAWLRAQHALVASIPEWQLRTMISEFERASAEALMSPDIPAEVADGLVQGLRAGVVTLALVRAIDLGSKPLEPWLARALVERLVSGIQGHLRLLASYPAASVPETMVPASERIDLVALGEQHARSRAHARRTLELARQRRQPADDA